MILDFIGLCAKHGIVPRGVLHAGACDAHTLATYAAVGVPEVAVIDAQPTTADDVNQTEYERGSLRVFKVVLCDRDGEERLYFQTREQFTSTLRPTILRDIYPHANDSGRLEVVASRLDSLMSDIDVSADTFNIFVLRANGAELRALIGAEMFLEHADAIFTSANLCQLYEGGAILKQVDDYLTGRSFVRVALETPDHPTWGEACYVNSHVYDCSPPWIVGRAEHDFYQRYLKRGMTVFEAGAGAGEWTRFFSAAVSRTGHVHAFEAANRAFEALRAKCEAAHCRNTVLIHSALSDSDEPFEVQVFSDPLSPSEGMAFRNRGLHVPPVGEETVTPTTIDQYCRTHEIPEIDLLRVKDAGAECRILRGARRMLGEERIQCCVIDTRGQVNGRIEDLHRLLSEYNYELRNLIPTDPLYGEATTSRAIPSKALIAMPRRTRHDTITMSSLGRNGRFGNQLFQYLFLKTYEADHQCQVETPFWVGRHLFGCSDPAIESCFPQVREKVDHEIDDTIVPHAGTPFRNVDFWGYFQYHTSYYAKHKNYIRALFNPDAGILPLVDAAYHRLGELGKTLVGLHLRRGDYGHGYFFEAPTGWYRSWLDEVWPTLENPALFIASDEPRKVLADFSDYHPVTASDLGFGLPAFPYYVDFYLLTRCDALAISNSSFSFAASMLNDKATTFVRPSLPQRRLIPFDPWNSMPLLRDSLEEAPTSNPRTDHITDY